MLRHIVLQRFKPEASAEERVALRAAIEGLRAAVPEIRSLVCGENVGSGPNHHDFAVVVDFDDMAAFRRYIDSAAHRAFVAGPAKIVEKLAAIQHEW
jgi:quinol monooxygenase YgiN